MELEFPSNIGDYLPKYLSAESFDEIISQLKAFPVDGTKDTIYTTFLKDKQIVFQGDGIANLPFYDAQTQRVLLDKPGIILSNTCDIDPRNERKDDMHICFAPILRLSKYIERLSGKYDNDKIIAHIENIKKQIITHVIYLPKGGDLAYDAIVPLDRVCYVSSSFINRDDLPANRLFTLSDFGNYLFLLKISIHFTRIREKVDRYKGIFLE